MVNNGQQDRSAIREKCHSHLLVDKLQTTVDGALGVGPILLEQDGPDQLVDGLVILELGKLLFDGQANPLLGAG